MNLAAARRPHDGRLEEPRSVWWPWPATVLTALGSCLIGFALLEHQPASPPAAVRHSVRRAPVRATVPAPVAPAGSTVPARVLAIDHQYGGITLQIEGEHYALHLSPSTVFPAPCLQRDHLRPGMSVVVVLPWYLSGDVYLSALSPAQPCTAPAPASLAPATGQSPPRPHTPGL